MVYLIIAHYLNNSPNDNYNNIVNNNFVYEHVVNRVRTRNRCNILIMLILSEFFIHFFKINFKNL